MLTQISLIFIVFILLLSTVLIYVKPNRIQQENFYLPTQTAANVPAQNNTRGKKFFVGNTEPEPEDIPIAPDNAKYEFRKQQLLYDGVWGENCKIDNQGFEKCDWEVMSGNFPLNKEGLTYGANHFFQDPKRLAIGQQIESPPDCPITAKMYADGPTYLEHNLLNPPIYLNSPKQEDILGFPPQDNRLYWDKPGVILGYL